MRKEQFLFTVSISHVLFENLEKGIRFYKTESIEITGQPYYLPGGLGYKLAGIEDSEKTLVFGFRCESRSIRSAILAPIIKNGVFINNDGPAILNFMGNHLYQINRDTFLTFHEVKMTSTVDEHRTCFTSTKAEVYLGNQNHLFQLDITFQHQEDPYEDGKFPMEFRYRPILIALKRLKQ